MVGGASNHRRGGSRHCGSAEETRGRAKCCGQPSGLVDVQHDAGKKLMKSCLVWFMKHSEGMAHNNAKGGNILDLFDALVPFAPS